MLLLLLLYQEACMYLQRSYRGRFAPPYKYMNKYIQQKQQQHLCLTVMLQSSMLTKPWQLACQTLFSTKNMLTLTDSQHVSLQKHANRGLYKINMLTNQQYVPMAIFTTPKRPPLKTVRIRFQGSIWNDPFIKATGLETTEPQTVNQLACFQSKIGSSMLTAKAQLACLTVA